MTKAGKSRSGGGSEVVVPFLGWEHRVWQSVWSERPFRTREPLWIIFWSGNRPIGMGSSECGRCLLGTGQIGGDYCGVFFLQDLV